MMRLAGMCEPAPEWSGIEWRPTSEQFDRYVQRELELARENLRGRRHTETLHSHAVCLLARLT